MAENNAKKEQVHTVFQNISKNTIDLITLLVSNNTKCGENML